MKEKVISEAITVRSLPGGQLEERPDYPDYPRGSSATVVRERGTGSVRRPSPHYSLSQPVEITEAFSKHPYTPELQP
ncbi:hypothetical protein AAFF_G00135390 [Aldrovandia affinis]|uniref:Uncharacterized protein n=1 Tax=Aldrovandia affinis TaxID=143900 RepID=A0AAD7RQG3_9TELE|nr:hypothetical protein AAFF_G00135390 [Aldrovandia affinis]